MRPGAALLAFAFLICFAAYAWGHDTGRYCSNPNCSMCLRLHLQAGHAVTASGSLSSMWSLHEQLHQQMDAQQHLLDEIEAVATPLPAVIGMLQSVKPAAGETLYDLGCGDGRFLIEAVQRYGCRAVGIERDKGRAELARQRIKEAGLDDKARVIVGDVLTTDFSDADVIVLYQFPELVEKLSDKLFCARAVVSYSHDIPSLKAVKWHVTRGSDEYFFYVWEPAVLWPKD